MQLIFMSEPPISSKLLKVLKVRHHFILTATINHLSSSDAGRAFTEAAQLHETKLDSRHEAANNYAEAAQVYRKVLPQGGCGI